MPHSELSALDRATVLHPSTHAKDLATGKIDPVIIDSAEGIRIRDIEGRELIDAFAGLYCVNIGYGRTAVADAISRQAHKLAYYHTYAAHTHEELIKLSDRLLKIAPGSGDHKPARVFYGTSGSDANETQAKLVWYYHNLIGKPKKKRIIARERAYHGNSVIAGSMTGLSLYHGLMDQPLPIILRTGLAHYYWGAHPGESEAQFSARLARELEELILREDPDTIGAFIGEPVLGTGGLIPPPAGYWAAIQAVLRKYDILLIADEVITGFGRTGQLFGSHKYGIEPDLITIAKGLTSAYAPLSASILSRKVYNVIEDGADKAGVFPHGYTYTGHPISVAAANANLDILLEEDLTGNAETVGQYFLAALKEAFADLPITGEIRGTGLMLAVEFVADPATKKRFDPDLRVAYRISTAARERGLITRAMPMSDAIGFAPPLNMTKADAEEIVAIASASARQVIEELSRESVLA